MKIRIGNATYTDIKDVKFDPSTDVTGTSLEINQFSASIKTADSIGFGDFASLYGDDDALWARYWITEVQEHDEYFVDIVAQSAILHLDRITLPARMYTNATAASVLEEVFRNAPNAGYVLDNSFSSYMVNGFCPEQSARERLQWLCFVMGAFVQDCFTERILILPISEEEAEVPMKDTFWRPSVTYGDFVTEVQVTSYSYAQGTPSNTDKWVSPDGINFYIQQSQKLTLKNTNVPATAAKKTISVDGVTIINSGNASQILSRLSRYYFKRMEVSFEAVGSNYLPGRKLSVAIDRAGRKVSGYAKQYSFSFGRAQKSRITIAEADSASGVALNLVYKGADGGQEWAVGTATYFFPAGYSYSIENPYFDYSNGGARYIFMPDSDTVEGTLGDTDTTVEVPCSVALKQENGILEIYSVDEVEQSGETLKIG